MSRARAKGTRFETEVVNALRDRGLDAQRMPASSRYDIQVRGNTGRDTNALVTRPDYGTTLVTISFVDFMHLLSEHGDGARIECKRFKKFAHHSIYADKFGA